MPVYEYRCADGHFYERAEGFDAPVEHECLRCGRPARRQLSVPTVIFKGSGFYSTDNRRSGGNGSSSTSGPGESNGSSSSVEAGAAD